MTIKTYAAWTYGHTINESNKFLGFSEAISGNLTAELNIGSYSLGEFVSELARALNAASLNQQYSTSIDRLTRRITISSSDNFDLLVQSATTSQQSVFGLAGFTGADLTGSNSYTGNLASGSYFIPQFLLQDYIDFDNDQRANNVTVNETPSGILEVIKFGDVNFMTCNIKYQKNQEPDEPRAKNNIIRYSQTGYTDLLLFMRYAATKAPLEFVPDIDNPNIFTRCLLESTTKESNGTGFTIRELYAEGFAEWFESGRLVFRKLIT